MNEQQTYQMEYEFPKKPENTQIEIKEDNALGDVYDIYGMASSVHSQITSMTRDYTLAKYNSNIIHEKFPKFIREQRKIVRILESFMIITKEELQKRFTKEYAQKAHAIMTKNFQDVQKLLLGELDEMVIISRAGKGEVIKAMLMHGKTREEQEEYNTSVETDSIIGKLKEKQK